MSMNEGVIECEGNCACGMREVQRDILIIMCFDISRLCIRAVLILLLIDSVECGSAYNEILRVF